jgi:hypothetical protein
MRSARWNGHYLISSQSCAKRWEKRHHPRSPGVVAGELRQPPPKEIEHLVHEVVRGVGGCVVATVVRCKDRPIHGSPCPAASDIPSRRRVRITRSQERRNSRRYLVMVTKSMHPQTSKVPYHIRQKHARAGLRQALHVLGPNVAAPQKWRHRLNVGRTTDRCSVACASKMRNVGGRRPDADRHRPPTLTPDLT